MVSFVLLHYIDYDLTAESIRSIFNSFNNKSNEFSIVVVDNCSPNDSGEKLLKDFDNGKNVKVILNKENSGFAKGNNIGYLCAKTEYNPDFIVVMNNDVFITDKDVEIKLKEIFDETHFHIYGPDIISPEKIHQNPLGKESFSPSELIEYKKHIEKELKHIRYYYYKNTLIEGVKNIIKKILGKKKKLKRFSESQIINPVLHGACVVYSKKYIEKEDVAFNPSTFLNFEEDILHYECNKKGYKVVFDDRISVFHLDGGTKKATSKNKVKREQNRLKNLLDSVNVLIDIMKKDKVL